MMRLGDILDLVGAYVNLASHEIAGLASDSRKVLPGEVFFALAGVKDDGLAHAAEALAKGACVIVAERAPDFAAPAFVVVGDARAALSHAAARFYPRQPAKIVAVTGTSGKTSVAAFTRQIWLKLGLSSASLGTIGIVSVPVNVYGSLTTPDPIALHAALQQLADAGVTHLAMEASSHGLDQKRLDGVRLSAGAFTNLSRDHLDYHPTMEAYLEAKLRLVRDLVPPGAPFVIDADSDVAPRVVDATLAGRPRAVHGGREGRGDPARSGDAARVSRPASNSTTTAAAAMCCCRCPAISRSPTPSSRRVCASPAAAIPQRFSRRWRHWKARRAGWSGSGKRTAPACSSITPTSPTRWKRRWRRCARS